MVLSCQQSLTVAPHMMSRHVGQGYIWQAHRQPMTAGWDLAQRSKCLWEDMAAEDGQLAAAMEWQVGFLYTQVCCEVLASECTARLKKAVLPGFGLCCTFLSCFIMELSCLR